MNSSADISPASPTATSTAATQVPRVRNAAIIAWTLALLFIVAAAELNLLTLTWARVSRAPRLQPAAVLAIALAFAEAGLIALVCGLGRQHFALRIWMFVCSSIAAAFFVDRVLGAANLGNVIALFFVYSTLVLLVTWLWQIRGWRLILADEHQPLLPSPWQFSVSNLFAVTTCVAFVFAVFRYFNIETIRFSNDLMLVSFVVIVPCMAAYLILTRQRLVLVALGLFATILVTACFWNAFNGINNFATSFFLMLLTSLFVLTGLVLARLAGYQLARDS
ncbi:hypothetical protein NA78x_000669 [Anatilimnocola sp. NA78]|uniref:hypothetical protein n=1 Tax=Anatilimnocola sp. NA78 TaxID=3415683 RepID=UPI003CE53192